MAPFCCAPQAGSSAERDRYDAVKQFDLRQLSQVAKLPNHSEGYWDRFPDRVIKRLQTERAPAVQHQSWRLGGLAAAAACGLILGFILWHHAPPANDTFVTLRDGPVLRELLRRYAGRLHAIVQDASGLHTQLSKDADVSASNPIWLEIRDGDAHRVVVTFSGQQIRCGGTDVIVLSDVEGQIILVGDGFFWSHQISAGRASKVEIRAEQIPGNRVTSKPSFPL